MLDNQKSDFKATELNPDLLSTPFEVKTNWHVITGAPSSGKTTLVNQLSQKGFQTAPEGARQYIEREIARGRTIDEIHANATALQLGIKDMQLEIERGLPSGDFIFLDRGIPDTLAWYRIFGLDPNQFLLDCFHHRYASVFILDRLPLDLNGFRFSDDAYVGFCDEWHIRDYCSLGYDLVRVPVLPPDERVEFVLERLSEQGLL